MILNYRKWKERKVAEKKEVTVELSWPTEFRPNSENITKEVFL